MAHIQCAKQENLGPVHQCTAIAQAKLNALITDEIKTDNIIGAGCCLFLQARDCVLERVVKACNETVDDPRATGEYLSQKLTDVAGELLDMVCGSFDSMESCRANPEVAEVLDKFEEVETQYLARVAEQGTEARPDRSKSFMFMIADLLGKTGI